MLKVYLDTNIFSRILDQDISELEFKAIDILCDRNDIELVTSKKTLEEFLKTPDDNTRISLKLLYKLISKVPSKNLLINYPATLGGAYLGAAPLGGGYSVENSIFAELKTIFRHDDAEHIFQAINSECDCFLTLDKKTILKRALVHKNTMDKLAPNLKIINLVELASTQ